MSMNGDVENIYFIWAENGVVELILGMRLP